eukprot:CAMPEP_0181223848 /NCGR_PEP_ID=MMETSP1096-20121128/30780_1 /TAXON_ID=156174 ORGANISM="Chrysochromulina ericina, Strain CCMP281" /NCGR_SAMPLE_ID=MMETSP1096 /ASSEMBLY_ACC=CAM_ASM_000453 /LENGTH=59 /DNA_ID=CAMNT_0023316827 /DNA_START=298 /DNA_END=477 /DNA_ORIENTATION=-
MARTAPLRSQAQGVPQAPHVAHMWYTWRVPLHTLSGGQYARYTRYNVPRPIEWGLPTGA